MRAVVFLGCTVPVRGLNYELSARKVAEHLGMELVDMPEGGCCGFPLKTTDYWGALAIAARVLVRAGHKAPEIVTLCSACGATLAEAAHLLEHDERARREVNRRLERVGLRYEQPVKVRHLLRAIWEEFGPQGIKAKVSRPLEGWSFAVHYGCHYLKPSDVLRGEDPEAPESLEGIVRALGAQVVEHSTLTSCCGGGVLGADEELAGAMAGAKLAELSELEPTALAVVCPFCNVMYEGQQKAIAKRMGREIKVAVVYLTQLMGLAMGMSPEELGFKLNRARPKELVKAFKD